MWMRSRVRSYGTGDPWRCRRTIMTVSHHHLKFLCVHASESVCVCNLSITIYTCKGQINTPNTKNLKTQYNSDLIVTAPEIYQRC